MLSSTKDKAISASASIALNVMIRFDEFYINPVEENKEIEYEQKISDMATLFELLEDSIRDYCEATTNVVPAIENSDTLFRVIMSECRLLHCNYSVVEHLAGNEEYLKNHMKITHKYPSGQLNDSI
mmetsp:Transcript_16328/g.16051  ORF Transcript_16328/g.16051 Transcript_16328/m.16051 type:complete len:126 (+) Transcript_16328:1472-1849(+)